MSLSQNVHRCRRCQTDRVSAHHAVCLQCANRMGFKEFRRRTDPANVAAAKKASAMIASRHLDDLDDLEVDELLFFVTSLPEIKLDAVCVIDPRIQNLLNRHAAELIREKNPEIADLLTRYASRHCALWR